MLVIVWMKLKRLVKVFWEGGMLIFYFYNVWEFKFYGIDFKYVIYLWKCNNEYIDY